MPTCSFCRKNYKLPRGLTMFTNEGRTVHFCSSKCRRNTDLGRDAKKVNWVKREKKEERKKKVVKEEKKIIEVKPDKREAEEVKKEEKKVEIDEDEE